LWSTAAIGQRRTSQTGRSTSGFDGCDPGAYGAILSSMPPSDGDEDRAEHDPSSW
jgi:hypothetical protein